MKSLVWIPLGLIAAAGAAVLILRQLKGAYFYTEIASAAGITLIASEMALIPLVLTRHAGVVAVSQAALVGTLVHMFFAFVLAAIGYSMGLVGDRQVFTFLLLSFYFVSLVFLVFALIPQIRRANPKMAPGGKV